MKLTKSLSVGMKFVACGVVAFIIVELLTLSILHRDMSLGASAAIMAVMVMSASRVAFRAGKKETHEATSEAK